MHSRRWAVPGLVSAGLHAAVLAALLIGLARHRQVLEPQAAPAQIELVMSPPGSAKDAPAASPAPDTVRPETPATQQVAAEPKPAAPPPLTPDRTEADPTAEPTDTEPAPAPEAGPRSAPPETTAADEALPLPPPPPPPQPETTTSPEQTAAAAQPVRTPRQTPPAPASRSAPEFSLGGVASDTNALVTGELLAPPSADPKFHNRKPSYPDEAARRGEQGAVVLMIHVSPDGLVRGVDIAQSSGFRLLDRAAREAVQTWHFLPAVRDGQPVPFDMPMRIVFDLN